MLLISINSLKYFNKNYIQELIKKSEELPKDINLNTIHEKLLIEISHKLNKAEFISDVLIVSKNSFNIENYEIINKMQNCYYAKSRN